MSYEYQQNTIQIFHKPLYVISVEAEIQNIL